MSKSDIAIFYPTSKMAWRKWLEKNHFQKDKVWLVFYKKYSERPTINWSDAVDVALCFGWIDSKKVAIDSEESHQFFCKRKPKSTWSKINKEKVANLIEAGLMTKAGYESIETAKQNGSWTILDEVEELIIPKDLEKAFKTKRGSKDFFVSLSKSMRKMILQWIVLAKRAETRQKRINDIAELAGQKLKPKQFR
ncbi:YdeI/OmpD-associated family protein [Parapedobacter tibetensis]|uniref:YdeI/OmpD-associated family protein n=1 Tax=Parapedobacter tibetensis TaxID=2972951 RepID=UPI00214D2C16|nr:YdeI/OmpD-associated family protein [Parapedobacter tibetensis]